MNRSPEPDVEPGGEPGRDELRSALDRYWRANLKVMIVLLASWAVAGLGFGVLLADRLGGLRIGGSPLGFWMAQQGAILVFVAVILIYALVLDSLDAAHRRELAPRPGPPAEPRG